tara:strand:+ start:1762 stop:3603 length:1842 start_codon:yes stop_codon:yes gene_type:complete
MAKTYFKAQPTAAETQINWAEVGKNFSDMLTEEARVREEKKGAIDEASRQYQETLNDVDQGQSATANQWWLNAAGEMQNQMLMQDRMLKSGALNPRDYTVMRQNLVDGTDGLIGVFGKFNEEFKDRMDRFENGESQDLEQWAMAEMENFGNFQQTSVVVNPETGSLSVADVDEDGNIINNPNSIRSVTSLQNLIARRYDKYDLEAATTEFAGSVGTWDTISRTYGSEFAKGLITKTSDPLFKGFTKDELVSLGMSEADAGQYGVLNAYKASEDLFVSEIMSVWSNTSSILTNSMTFAPNGEEYTFTFDKEDRAENKILLVKDPQGQLRAEYTPEQEKAVAQAIRDSLRNKLDREIGQATPVADFTRPTAQQEKAAAGQKDAQDLVGVWSELYYKEGEQKQASLDALLSSQKAVDSGLIDIKVNDRAVEFVYTNPAKNRTIAIPENPTQDDWIRVGVELHGIADIDEATRAAGRFPEDAEFGGFTDEQGQAITFEAQREGPTPEVDPVAEVARRTATAVKDEFFFDQTNTDVQADIKTIVAPLGLTVSSDVVGNNMTITNPETGATITVNTNEDAAESAKQAEALRAFINGQLTKANSEAYLRGAGAATTGELD